MNTNDDQKNKNLKEKEVDTNGNKKEKKIDIINDNQNEYINPPTHTGPSIKNRDRKIRNKGLVKSFEQKSFEQPCGMVFCRNVKCKHLN